jgi:hypothetical protein
VYKKGAKASIKSSARPKSAEDLLLESVGELIDAAAERMTAEEFRQTAKRANEILDRALARPRPHRETA